MMQPGFQTTMQSGNCIIFLFSGFVLDEPWKYGVGILLAFMMGLSNELFLYFRRWVAAQIENKHKLWRIAICAIYGAHMTLAYWLMLLVMTYETLIFIAIVLGLAAGHLLFQFAPLPKTDTHNIQGSTPCCGGSWDHISK